MTNLPRFPCLILKRGETDAECETCPCADDKARSIVDGIQCPWSLPVDDPARPEVFAAYWRLTGRQKT